MIKIDLINFLVVGLFLIIWNAVLHLINVEARRNKLTTVAAVSGLHG